MIDSILKLQVGMYVDVLIEGKEWVTQRIIEIQQFNNNTPGGVFAFIEFEDHSRYTIWNATPLKFVCDTIRISTLTSNRPSPTRPRFESTIPAKQPIVTTTFNGVANTDYFNQHSYNNWSSKSDVIKGKSLPEIDDDLPDAVPIELYKETFGDIYRVNEKGERID